MNVERQASRGESESDEHEGRIWIKIYLKQYDDKRMWHINTVGFFVEHVEMLRHKEWLSKGEKLLNYILEVNNLNSIAAAKVDGRDYNILIRFQLTSITLTANH